MFEPFVERSVLDEQRFGIPTTRALVTSVAEAHAALQVAQQGSTLLIVRCPCEALDAVRCLEAGGARLMDTLIYLGRLAAPRPGEDPPPWVREAAPSDVQAVGAIAREAFAGYRGHYHADPRLDRARCDEVYVDWAEKSVRNVSASDGVIVAEEGGTVLGFATVRMADAHTADLLLNAVAPKAQGRGVNRGVGLGVLAWARQHGAERLIVSTQITNLNAQRVWCRLGFEPDSSFYTLHWWRDDH